MERAGVSSDQIIWKGRPSEYELFNESILHISLYVGLEYCLILLTFDINKQKKVGKTLK